MQATQHASMQILHASPDNRRSGKQKSSAFYLLCVKKCDSIGKITIENPVGWWSRGNITNVPTST